MIDSDLQFLPCVNGQKVIAALARAGGSEIASGKFVHPESSAALACNSFGAFLDEPASLPPFPSLADLDWPAVKVEVEREMGFPWGGGRHPWLDAAVETAGHLIGVESKRFEPYRDSKAVSLSEAYDRPVWGDHMQAFCTLRDELRSGAIRFRFLDAAQLIKHGFGLVTEARRLNKTPNLLYLFAEPAMRGTTAISRADLQDHRREVAMFAEAVRGSAVRFAANSYREWLDSWPGSANNHATAIVERFQP